VVTGGSKGLGKQWPGFAQAGADVVISSRHTDELRKPSPKFWKAPVGGQIVTWTCPSAAKQSVLPRLRLNKWGAWTFW
jgi:NAD(P)-dependent dehydrogenase (short-subunit alcohol dehydrogenase family)